MNGSTSPLHFIKKGTQRCANVATCNLNQWSLDFEGNLQRTIESIKIAKNRNCKLRIGPELELCGYGCEDHFLEEDTILHCWQSIETILESGITNGILCCFGMPVKHNAACYNCVIWICNSQIILIRPKMHLANDGNYREPRFFTAWSKQFAKTEDFVLPLSIQKLTNKVTVPIGPAIIQLKDASVASETCEELFTPLSPFIHYALNGADIVCNSSGSHHNLRKLDVRLNLMRNSSRRCGGVYLYSNQQGCDGNRLYYDGCSMILQNGDLIKQASQFSVIDVEVISAVVDLTQVTTHRHFPSLGVQADMAPLIARVYFDFELTDNNAVVDPPMKKPFYHRFEEEIAYGPACWLWDFLRRSGASGYFLPLSGGADSGATAAIVGVMCQLVIREIVEQKNEQVLTDARRIVGIANPKPPLNWYEKIQEQKDGKNEKVDDADYVPVDAKELCGRLFHTCYMGTKNSSKDTRRRASSLAKELGSYHYDTNIDSIVESLVQLFVAITGKTPKFKAFGGGYEENLALQNIQARLRMILSYFLAQLLPWVRGRRGFLLVLGSANVDEALRGYMTKYDCSSADINPIGAICKVDLKAFLQFAAEQFGYPTLAEITQAKASAELEPTTSEYKQISEEDMGMTYEELHSYGVLRKIAKCGPVAMYQKLETDWGHLRPALVAKKVKDFFNYYSRNRHKLTTLTPSYHAENYSPDDNRFDHRPFLYPNWERQYRTIDELVKQDEILRTERLKQTPQ